MSGAAFQASDNLKNSQSKDCFKALKSKPFRKVILSGNVIEVYEYEQAPLMGCHRPPEEHDSPDWVDEWEDEIDRKLDELPAEIQHMLAVTQGRLPQNITRTRNMVRRLILANFDNNSRFVTFTFRDNIQDVQEANKHWNAFIKRLRRKYDGFKYIAVVEFQKRGAVHYHMLSDIPFVKASEMERIWGNGFIKINKITHVDNVGAYVIKYMTKDLTDIRLFANKAYNCSLGLERPVVLRGELAEEIIRMYDLETKKIVFANSYISEHLGQITYREYNLTRL